jgi:TonB family protein
MIVVVVAACTVVESTSAQAPGPLSIEIERYQNTADSGANFKVMNPTAIEYHQCSIELGDSGEKRRWFLPNPTALDAEGLRSYPTLLFRDRKGITPPTAIAIRYVLIKCSSPRFEQAFHINPKAAQKPPEPAPEQDYEDVLAQLRKKTGETTPKPVEQAAVQPAAGATRLGQLPEVARWIRDVKMKVTQAWILAPGFPMQPLETQLDVQIGPSGEVRGMRITQSSGNPWFDESVERAFQKASPLPAPPEAGEYPFSFKPSDLL